MGKQSPVQTLSWQCAIPRTHQLISLEDLYPQPLHCTHLTLSVYIPHYAIHTPYSRLCSSVLCGREHLVYTPRLLGVHNLLYYTHFIIFCVWNTSYCAYMFCTHNVLHHPHLRIFITHEDTALYPYPTVFSIGNAFNLHTWCYPVLQPLPCTPTRRCCACRTCQHGLSSPCPRLSVPQHLPPLDCILNVGTGDLCAHAEFAGKYPADLVHSSAHNPRKGECPLPPDLMFLPSVFCPQGHTVTHHGSSHLPSDALDQTRQLPFLPRVHFGSGPSPPYLGWYLDISCEGFRGAGRGGTGLLLMQSRGGADRAAALAVGGRRPPRPPTLAAAGRAQSEQDLVPCSGYGALSGPAASLK